MSNDVKIKFNYSDISAMGPNSTRQDKSANPKVNNNNNSFVRKIDNIFGTSFSKGQYGKNNVFTIKMKKRRLE